MLLYRRRASDSQMKEPVALDDVEAAVSVLRNGGVIAMPTDTLYALTAIASDAAAVERVYAIKGREEGKALPLLVDGPDMAESAGVFNSPARRLAARFWPGQLTIVVPKQTEFQSHALAGLDTVALRLPDSEVARSIIEAVGAPVTGTSANRSGHPGPVSPAEVRRQLGDEIDLLVDGGGCPEGVSSTIVDCTCEPPRILRGGAISPAMIDEALRSEG
jgi:L-threonylcarbamoyladenylate synthase